MPYILNVKGVREEQFCYDKSDSRRGNIACIISRKSDIKLEYMFNGTGTFCMMLSNTFTMFNVSSDIRTFLWFL